MEPWVIAYDAMRLERLFEPLLECVEAIGLNRKGLCIHLLLCLESIASIDKEARMVGHDDCHARRPCKIRHEGKTL